MCCLKIVLRQSPDSHVPDIAGTYCIDTGVVNLPNLLPVIEKLVADNQGLRPIKAKDSEMRNHKHCGTPQDTSLIGDIVRYIDGHGGFKDWEKDLLINRITVPTAGLDSPEVLRAMEGTSEAAPQQPSEVPDPNQAQDAPSNPAPLPISIAKDDDGHFCIAIAGRKWKIMRHGIIGNGAADREDFHQAASELADNALPFSDAGLERVVLASDLLSLADDARAYRSAMNYRASVWKSLGEVMYDAYCQSLPSSEAKQPTWAEVVNRYAWDNAANAVYLSVGLDPADINRELQIVAARKRMQLLRSVYVSSSNIGTVAAEIAAIAGPTPQT